MSTVSCFQPLNLTGIETALRGVYGEAPRVGELLNEISGIARHFLNKDLHDFESKTKFNIPKGCVETFFPNEQKERSLGKYHVCVVTSEDEIVRKIVLYMKLPKENGRPDGGAGKSFGTAFRFVLSTDQNPTVQRVARLVSKAYQRLNSKFSKEIKLLRKFTGNPSVVQVFDDFEYFSKTANRYKVVAYQELFDCDLFDALADPLMRKPKSARLDKLRPVFLSLLQAIASIHEKGITHRDLKVDNIFLSVKLPPGVPLRGVNGSVINLGQGTELKIAIGDFGFSTDMSDPVNPKLGSMEIFPPEQFAMRGALDNQRFQNQVNRHAGDLWALGINLFCFYCGNRIAPPWCSVGELVYRLDKILGVFKSDNSSLPKVSKEVQDGCSIVYQNEYRKFLEISSRILNESASHGLTLYAERMTDFRIYYKTDASFVKFISPHRDLVSICIKIHSVLPSLLGEGLLLTEEIEEHVKKITFVSDYMKQLLEKIFFEELEKSTTRPTDNPYEQIIQGFLRLKPDDRMSIEEALQILSKEC